MTTDRQRKLNAKQKSENYFNRHRKSRLARGGYWRHDYRFQLEEIGRRKPERLIEKQFPRCPGIFSVFQTNRAAM